MPKQTKSRPRGWLKIAIIDATHRFPYAYSGQIASLLQCEAEYVRIVWQRTGLRKCDRATRCLENRK